MDTVAEDALVVRTELVAEDFCAFNLYALEVGEAGRVSRLIWRVGTPVALLVFATLAAAQGRFIAAAFDIVGCVVWLAIGRPFYRASMRRMLLASLRGSKNRTLLGPRYYEFGPNGLMSRTELSEGRTQWSALERVAVTPDHAFLFTGSTTAYIVPRRAFADDAAFRRFLDLVHAYANAPREPVR